MGIDILVIDVVGVYSLGKDIPAPTPHDKARSFYACMPSFSFILLMVSSCEYCFENLPFIFIANRDKLSP